MRRYESGIEPTQRGTSKDIASYRNALSQVVQTAALPYGLTLSTWGAGAAVQHFRGTPELWQIFLFVAGGVGGYMLATLAITRQLKESGPAAPDARMALSGTLHLVAVGAATGAAALVGKIHDWIAWPLGGAAAILVYLLFAGAEYQIAPRLPIARGQRLERAVECRSDGTEFEEESCVEGSGAACGRSNPRSSAGPALQWRGFGAPTPTPPGRAAGSRRRPTRVLACRAAATWTLQTWAYKVLFEMPYDRPRRLRCRFHHRLRAVPQWPRRRQRSPPQRLQHALRSGDSISRPLTRSAHELARLHP